MKGTRMKKYCVVEKNFVENHAGSKARNDIADTLMKNAWIPLVVHHSEEKGILDKIKMVFLTWMDWNKIHHMIPPDSELLVQYPLAMYPKVSTVAIPFLKKLKRKNVKLIFLIHDLDSLRGIYTNGEKEFLSTADTIIAHNPIMVEYLKKQGYGDKEIRSLNIFDYLMQNVDFEKRPGKKTQIVIAGNLKREKAGYIYQLEEVKGNLEFRLYGPNYDGVTEGRHVKYCGQFKPEELPEKLEGGFGLVWDGENIESCTGVYGEYMKYNNPHKTSLYLASGLPVIIWDQAALAPFIEKNNLGFIVENINEISEKLDQITEQDYKSMRKNVRKFQEQLSQGRMLLTVLGK